ncbi:MAG: methyltransferase domain-containing protein [Gomphosphaeria aponina SAG 52.96 = DSM 107014]|uniref:Methyltransferase domain-containing protein n=1 Tax=Gomphosphaeria aponina SAG 52.96 = DSM 107014 TaxID=1521640 RepID=A0A941JUX2_9CHRO|nr:methyltransferase domain-containing protein [Gomphosphaeria aponina SAG 52.96 = DSM 107014]
MNQQFQQEVATYFNKRNNYDQEGDFHPKLAARLIQHSQISQGQKILDMATGTGLVAIEAAKIVGEKGWVVGVDISPGMLSLAEKKILDAGLTNIELQQADALKIELPEKTFDWVFCCASLPYLENIPQALQHWQTFLKPGGRMGLCVFGETAFIAGIILRQVAQKYGVFLLSWNETTGTEEKCYQLLNNVGFQQVKVITEQFGGYISLAQAKKIWDNSLINPLCRPLQQISASELKQLQGEFFTELEELVTELGIWNDITTFFVFAD